MGGRKKRFYVKCGFCGQKVAKIGCHGMEYNFCMFCMARI